MKSPARIVVLVLGLSIAPVTSFSQSEADKDATEIQQYTLTMDKVTRFAEVFGDLAKLAKDNPQLTAIMESSADGHESIAGIEKRISTEPPIITAITEHGFTTHEFVVLEVTIFQAAMAAAAKQQGADSPKLVVEGHVNPANVAFMEQHKAEFEELQKKYGAAQDSN